MTACAAAAARAGLDHAHETAARWWERALEVLDADPAGQPGLRQELLLRAGGSLARSGAWADAQRLLGEAIGAALDRGDPATAATAADQLVLTAGLWFPVEYETHPEELVQRLEAVVTSAGDDVSVRVRALAALATYCHYGPDRGRGLRESARALELARRSGRADLLVAALLGRLQAAWVPGHEDALADAAEELLGLVDEDERPEVVVLALARRGVTRLVQGDVDGDGEDLARAWDVAERAGLPLVQAQLVTLQAARATLVGEFALALELVDRAVVLTQRTQLYEQTRQDLVSRAFVWIDQGCLPERLAEFPPVEPTGAAVLLTAVALLQAGQPAVAAEVMAAADGFAPYPQQWDALSFTCWQAVVAAELAATVGIDPAVPAAITDRLRPFADQLAVQGGVGALGPVSVFLGRAEAAAGRTEDAERHLREAITTASRLGLRPSLARVHLALAELLADRRSSEAAVHAAEALRLAEDLGMRLVARRAAELATAGRTAGRGRPLRWAGTSRV